MNAENTTMDTKCTKAMRDVMTVSLYSVGIGAGAVAGLVALLLVA